MKDPARLIDGDDAFERALLDAASDDVSPELEDRVLAGLGLEPPPGPGDPGAGGPASAAGGNGSAGVAEGGATKSSAVNIALVVGSLGVAAAVGGYWLSGRSDAPEPPRQTVGTEATVAAIEEAPPPKAEQPPPADPGPDPPQKDVATRGAPAAADRPGPSNAPPPVASSKSTLSAEVAALDRARKALAGGNSGGAMTELDRYRRDFPKGLLGAEATVLRVRALLAQGQRAQAESLGRRVIARNPKGFYAKQIRALIGEEPPRSDGEPRKP